jgi:hypothetical protein
MARCSGVNRSSVGVAQNANPRFRQALDRQVQGLQAGPAAPDPDGSRALTDRALASLLLSVNREDHAGDAPTAAVRRAPATAARPARCAQSAIRSLKSRGRDTCVGAFGQHQRHRHSPSRHAERPATAALACDAGTARRSVRVEGAPMVQRRDERFATIWIVMPSPTARLPSSESNALAPARLSR